MLRLWNVTPLNSAKKSFLTFFLYKAPYEAVFFLFVVLIVKPSRVTTDSRHISTVRQLSKAHIAVSE